SAGREADGVGRGRGSRPPGHGAGIDLRSLLPWPRAGAGAGRPRTRTMDREVDRRAPGRDRVRRAHTRAAHALYGHAAAQGRRMKVLVAEDDADLLALVC